MRNIFTEYVSSSFPFFCISVFIMLSSEHLICLIIHTLSPLSFSLSLCLSLFLSLPLSLSRPLSLYHYLSLFFSYSLIFFLSPLQLYRAHAVHRGNLYVRLDRRFKNEILHRSSHHIARGKYPLSLLFYFHHSSYVLLFALFSLS